MDIFETAFFFYMNRPPMNQEQIRWFRVNGRVIRVRKMWF